MDKEYFNCCCVIHLGFVERSTEAPSSTDGANLKLQGQSLVPTPVASSGWYGDVFISSKISGRCAGNVTRQTRQIHEKNPRIPRGPRSKNLSPNLISDLGLKSYQLFPAMSPPTRPIP